MKRHQYIFGMLAAFAAVVLGGCSANDDFAGSSGTLIGRAVTFDPSLEALLTRTNHDGFNTNDVMNIYRSEYASGDFNPETNWVQYKLNQTTDAAGNVLSRNWKVNTKATKYHSTSLQTEADSISWENQDAVRFRAWAQSTISNYNDYMYADYASVAGPVASVPILFKHLGCRIGFSPRSANSISKVAVCTDAKYYTDDTGTGALTAQQKADNVKAAWEKVCEPGGVQMYSNCDNDGYEWGTTTEISEKREPLSGALLVKPNTGTTLVRGKQYATSAEVTANTSRPSWHSIDGTYYTVVCPYEMASATYGDLITLPAYTRFEVQLYDVNNGDAAATSGYEGGSHTFALGDVKSNGTAVYPNGMVLQAGYSYMFTIGYYYGQLSVTPADSFAWTNVSAGSIDGTDNQPTSQDADYSWWVNAMNDAAEAAYNGENIASISPTFNISTVAQWKGFVNIVNGNVPTGSDKLYYYLYTPQNGQTPKSIDRYNTYLSSAFNFEGFTVNIANDIDFQDESIESAGTSDNPFKGSFNGGFHTISNANFANGCIFGTVSGYKDKDHYRLNTLGYVRISGTKNTTFVQDAEWTNLWGVYLTGPSSDALATKAVQTVCVGCAHVGTGASNGPLVGDTGSSYNAFYSCFIAAASNGYVGGGTNTGYSHCYYDKTLTPTYTGAGSNASSSDDIFYNYKVRGVTSSVLKAKYDNNYGGSGTSYNFNLYYQIAPWKVMNRQFAGTASTFHFELPTRYADQYPVMVTGAAAADQHE
jgi:hypothetical protein